MRKNILLGLLITLLGVIVGTVWRMQSDMNAHYRNFDYGYYLILPGMIIFLMGINAKSQQTKMVKVAGNTLLILAGSLLCGLGQSIALQFYPWPKVTYDLTAWIYFALIAVFLPLGSWLMLKKK